MSKDITKSLFHFILIALFQVFVLNQIHLFGLINPLIYIWFIILLPINTKNWVVLISSFAIGLAIDVFEGQMGFHSLVTVFMGFIRPIFISIFFNNKETDELTRPSISQMGIARFVPFIFIFIFIHHFLYFTLEIFTFSEFFMTLLRILLSSITTSILIVLLDLLFIRRSN